jgi:hypothetical protein
MTLTPAKNGVMHNADCTTAAAAAATSLPPVQYNPGVGTHLLLQLQPLPAFC